MKKILILGFYERQNIGDDSYITAFIHVFPGISPELFVFRCMDDNLDPSILDDIEFAICGGGDIINDYFMLKAQELFKNYTGKIYAVSIGIPYESCAKYLHMFDHVFVRSTSDYNIACKEIGSKNVDYCKDITFQIPYVYDLSYNLEGIIGSEGGNVVKIAICLAQPMFYNNDTLLMPIVKSLLKLYKKHRNIEYHFIAFNYSENEVESDSIINEKIYNKLVEKNKEVPVFLHTELCSARDIMDFLNTCSFSLCSRYHSVVFSSIVGLPCVALYSSSKVHNFILDNANGSIIPVKLDVDNEYRPIVTDSNILSTALFRALSESLNNVLHINRRRNIERDENNIIYQKIIIEKKCLKMMVKDIIFSFDDILNKFKNSITKYLGIDAATYENILYSKQKLCIGNKAPLDVARFICFIISQRTHHPCVWGLAHNMLQDDFCLYEAIQFIWECGKLNHEMLERCGEVYYPTVENFERRTLINLDYIFQNDFSAYHRSGWSYVIGGLMHIDAPQILRNSDILLDTYVDRSFHWGLDIMSHTGVLPYKQPWYGFVHHTFDTTHSDFNCTRLFENPVFLESLKECCGLLALSKTLGQQMRDKIYQLGLNVNVYVLYHPMEFVDNGFTMEKFLDNPNKRLVQIGAWLRNPYSIYELNLTDTRLTKTALRGKEMDQYFAPPGFMSALEDLLIKKKWFDEDLEHGVNNDICRGNHNGIICRDVNKNTTGSNKFCQGLYDMTLRQISSVEILEKLSNDDYDKLLSENIVFLNLVDCSAVNTVIECIVRDTPLVINRHPALVEILGPEYPGFYDKLSDIPIMMTHLYQFVSKVHEYMKKLDKTRYRLDVFVDRLQTIIEKGNISDFIPDADYDIFKAIPSAWNKLVPPRYSIVTRFLPKRYIRFR